MIKRDTQEFFDWWYERIDKFHKMYPWAEITSWGCGIGVRVKEQQECFVHLPEGFFMKMIGEDKMWLEYE